jgi:hypothetical protein
VMGAMAIQMLASPWQTAWENGRGGQLAHTCMVGRGMILCNTFVHTNEAPTNSLSRSSDACRTAHRW